MGIKSRLFLVILGWTGQIFGAIISNVPLLIRAYEDLSQQGDVVHDQTSRTSLQAEPHPGFPLLFLGMLAHLFLHVSWTIEFFRQYGGNHYRRRLLQSRPGHGGKRAVLCLRHRPAGQRRFRGYPQPKTAGFLRDYRFLLYEPRYGVCHFPWHDGGPLVCKRAGPGHGLVPYGAYFFRPHDPRSMCENLRQHGYHHPRRHLVRLSAVYRGHLPFQLADGLLYHRRLYAAHFPAVAGRDDPPGTSSGKTRLYSAI